MNIYNYYERPVVQFTGIMAAKLQTATKEVLFTNQPNFLALPYQDKPWHPSTTTYWESEEEQTLTVNIGLPIAQNEPIQTIILLLFFHVELHRFARVETPLIAVVAESTHGAAKGGLHLISDFVIDQNRILPGVVQLTPYTIDYPVDMGSEYFERTIHSVYDVNRSVLIHLNHRMVYWSPLDTTRPQFIVNATIHYVYSQFSVRPGFWYVLKFTWIQYLTIALIFIYFGEKIRAYVYSRQLVTTTVTSTLHRKHNEW
ncbi:unnamed protein product [Dicrocoelium dendriticum]|nr:unnamed protein product [Dicrocoelium dendriticum]